MMGNINIRINKNTRQVNLSKSVIGNDGENLQEKLVFSFDFFVNGTARLELIKQGETASYIMLTKVDETYELPIKSVITKAGRLNMQLVITEGTDDEEIPVFKSNQFYMIVNSSINAEIEEDDEYPEWIDVANTKLNQLDNIDIEAEQTQSGATITITKKDGTEESVELTNGIPGQDGANGITPTIGNNGNWYLGETDTGKPSRGIQGETGAPGSAGQDGISPIANITKSGNTATITITDKSGTTTATVSDGVNGVDGQPGRDGYVQYTAGENITIENNVISATGGSQHIGELAEIKDTIGYVDFKKAKKGIYVPNLSNESTQYISSVLNNTLHSAFQLNYVCIYITKEITDMEQAPSEKTYFGYMQGLDKTTGEIVYVNLYVETNGVINQEKKQPVNWPKAYYITNQEQEIIGLKKYITIPQVSSYTAPTNDKELVAKKYVDDKIGDINTILASLTTPGGE